MQVYSDVIAGQFFGHAHTDSFRVIYDDYGSVIGYLFKNILYFKILTIPNLKKNLEKSDRPISWILLAPAVSPREPGLAEGNF